MPALLSDAPPATPQGDATLSFLRLRSMYSRPEPGQRIIVVMKDGRQLDCAATMVYTSRGAGIIIYHKRKAVDESRARGWWPAT